MSDRDDRSDLLYGPKVPDGELPDTSRNSWKKEYAKRGVGVLGAAGMLYTGYELGTGAGSMNVENFIDSIEPSVEEVLEGAAETGSEAAIAYGPAAASYAVELSNGLL